ncbi:MAG: beta-ketoacyl-ACP synthase II [Lachnospiraceae bacterium]|nr:beta-ketoacyl-ACP synthase II [Lachnospiraceae bacterium]MDE6626157.1 beta-ketoacyl-ACP synthase II [Lachnospiraceae bacterium]
MMRRVVVTGMGAITPIGLSVDEFWSSVKEGKVGIEPISKFDASEFKAKIAAEVKGFAGKDYMDSKTAKRMELFSQYAVAAAKEALEQSGIDMEKEDPYRVGTAVGSGTGSLQSVERNIKRLNEKGPARIEPLLVPMMISNMASGNVSIYFGLKGKSINVVTACATGTHNIGEAFRTIQYGDADVMVAGGAEACVTPIVVGGFSALTALNTTEDCSRASIPFDKDRAGFVLGEGAGVVVLEELEHAKARGAKILAEIVGYSATSDAYHITSPAEDGMGAANAMIYAMKDAGVDPSEVDYINAHGTSTHHNDLFETRAIKIAMKDAQNDVLISSTKSMVGHLLGAAGGVEFITCVKSIEDGYIHENVGLREVEDPEEFSLNYVKDHGISKDVDVCMTNSLGFGGHNATLVVRKYKD